jgi:HK97 family phage major capsid protein
MFAAVGGHSTLAKLSGQKPIPFAGETTFVFSQAGKAAIVGEGENKPVGEGTVAPVVCRPYKFVYQYRVSDEFVYNAESRMEYLKGFADGFAKIIAESMDIAAMHGVNPYDMTDASFKATGSFDGLVTAVETYDASTIDTNIADAVAAVQSAGADITGIALSPTAGAALAALKANGVPQFPEFRFGQNPDTFYGMASDVNRSVEAAGVDHVIVGDFANAFKWGYAKNIPMEVIQYGDPDGQGDLKRTNEVVLRAEAYIGWAILDPNAFAIVAAAGSSGSGN